MAGTVAPIAGWERNVTSGFGPRRAPRTSNGRTGSRFHQGIDIGMPRGTPFKAAKDGQVVHAGWAGGYGKMVVLKHNDGTFTKYAHADSLNVRVGQQVKAGDPIGKVGSTGNSTGPHLHFEVRQGDWRTGQAVDPRPLLKGAAPNATPGQVMQQPCCAGPHGDDKGQTPGQNTGTGDPNQPTARRAGRGPDRMNKAKRAKRRRRNGRAAGKSAGKPRKGARRQSRMQMPQAQAPSQRPPAGGSVRPADFNPAAYQNQQTPNPTADATAGQGHAALREKLARAGVDSAFISQMSQKYGVPENMILSVIQQESGGNPRAHSRAGAAGLMQLMPGTARELGVRDRYNPRENVEGGVKYLGRMMRAFNGNQSLALAAYNAGPGRVRRAGGIPRIRETQNYVAVIQRNMRANA